MDPNSLEAFYAKYAPGAGHATGALVPSDLSHQVGHFNVFNIADLLQCRRERAPMLFDRRPYYKISLCHGPSRVDYADRTLDIKQSVLYLATPRVPYRWLPSTFTPSGYFCIFNEEFLLPARSTGSEELPVLQPGAYPLREITVAESAAVEAVFIKMAQELASSYAYKYDLLRTYLWELIHLVQKLVPAAPPPPTHTASERLAAAFADLLERQFPLASPQQQVGLRTPTDYASHLAVHVNHLNRVLKEATGHTTTELIGGRLTQEAKILLKQTNWSISEIAYSLGFSDVGHFCTFFKRQASLTPSDFRN